MTPASGKRAEKKELVAVIAGDGSYASLDSRCEFERHEALERVGLENEAGGTVHNPNLRSDRMDGEALIHI